MFDVTTLSGFYGDHSDGENLFGKTGKLEMLNIVRVNFFAYTLDNFKRKRNLGICSFIPEHGNLIYYYYFFTFRKVLLATAYSKLRVDVDSLDVSVSLLPC